MAGSIGGKLLAVTVNGVRIRCQTDATLTLTTNMTDDDPCKPDDNTPAAEASYVTRTVDSRDWTLSVSAKSFLDNIEMNQSDLSELFIQGNLDAEVEFLSTPGQHNYPEDVVYSGSAIISSITINAPASGASTHDTEFSGNGPMSITRIPVAPSA